MKARAIPRRTASSTDCQSSDIGTIPGPGDGDAFPPRQSVSHGDDRQRRDSQQRERKRVLIIDERPFRRECAVRLLREVSPDHDFAALARPQDLLAGAPCPGAGETFDIVILDIGATRLPDPRVETDIACLAECFSQTPIILLSDREDSGQVAQALAYGTRGLIPTALDPAVVTEAVRLVVAGGTFVPATALVQALGGLREDDRYRQTGGAISKAADLTPREVDVLELLREGKPNKIIAAQLDLKETTVKIHVRNIMKKLKANNRTEAALMAERAL